jgi:hypothetical protein
MKSARAITAVCAIAIIASPATALAKNGGDSDRGSTRTPALSPSGIAGACLTLGATNSGLTLKKGTDQLRFRATSCSSTTQTYQLSVLDEATRVLYPGWDCGVSRTESSLTIAAGRSATVSLPLRSGACAPASAESHFVTLTAIDADGVAAATAYAGWRHPVRTESR